jgi:hypothetical protein
MNNAIPPTMMDNDLIPDFDTFDLGAYGVDDARRVATAYMKIPRLTLSLADGDDIYRDAARGPNVVEIDAGRHDGDQHLVGQKFGYRHHLDLESASRVAETILPDHLSPHLSRHLAEWRSLTDLDRRPHRHRNVLPPSGCPSP